MFENKNWHWGIFWGVITGGLAWLTLQLSNDLGIRAFGFAALLIISLAAGVMTRKASGEFLAAFVVFFPGATAANTSWLAGVVAAACLAIVYLTSFVVNIIAIDFGFKNHSARSR